ncbi:MAG: NusA antitermination factor [Candidatus Woesebacteria bacterium GW2011_GWB1_39_10]|uniref:Transcription termination/antitermination protein NusA n=2 Tax=Candidatus Woeseibacteriota TaxID=1752722 RepID=A0A0G0LJN0_9BACT|nr:MAG: NusA antitermination factor [Candidatus Woesebacteria bacterium GW2011_GWB1_39_10]KKS91058.1 MAG: NusA antitermination factor [Candidatus Woesebacteria bacterium GW2011_GWA1_43_12]
MQTARTEFSQALKAIAQERGLDPDVILDTIKQAIIAAYKRDAKEQGEDVDTFDYEAVLDPVSGETRVFAWVLPAEDATEKEKAKAKKEKRDVTPPGFGRIAAQTAKQVIHQKIREAEKGAIMEEFEEKVGSLASGLILRFDGPNVRVDLGRTEAILLVEDRIPNERLDLNQRLTFLIKVISETPRGKEIFLSRAAPEFVEKLFAREVPEISSKSVEIKSIAREAGVRTKVAVFSSQTGVDPVGSCVGQKGVRVQAVTNEIGGERVDVIPWSQDVSELIKASLSPAESLIVTLDKERMIARVSAPEDQLSMAIGKDGQNVRLTAKLTGYRIEVEGNGELTKIEELITKNEESAVVIPPVKKITKTKAKKLAKKAKSALAEKSDTDGVEKKDGEGGAQENVEPSFPVSVEPEKTDDGSEKSDNEK